MGRSNDQPPMDRLKSLLSYGYAEPPLVFPIVGYHVAYVNNLDFYSYLLDWEKMPLLQYNALKEYGSDFLALAMDLTLEAEALGANVSYHAVPPSISKHVAFTEDHVNSLFEARSKYLELGRFKIILKSVKRLVELNREGRVVCGYVTGPLTLVSNIYGPEVILKSFIKEPGKLDKSLEAATGLQLEYIAALAEAGVDAIAVLEPVAALISPQHYARFLLGRLKAIFKEIERRDLVGILHTCGNAVKLIKNMGETNAHVLSLDHYVDLVEAFNVSGKIVMGNVPTVYFLEGRGKVWAYTIQLLEKTRSFKHIVASGCEIPAYAEPEIVKELSQAVVNWFDRSKHG